MKRHKKSRLGDDGMGRHRVRSERVPMRRGTHLSTLVLVLSFICSLNSGHAEAAETEQGEVPASGALVDAARRGDGKGLRAALEAGANVNVADEEGYTALHWAATATTNTECVKILLDNGADVDTTIPHSSRTPLRHVKTEAIAKILLEHGADPNRRHSKYMPDSPLQIAAWCGRTNLVQMYLAAGATTDIFTAVCMGNTDMVAEWIRRAPHLVNSVGPPTLLSAAVKTGSLDMVKLLVANGADPHMTGPSGLPGTSAIEEAAGKPEILKLLASQPRQW